MKMKLVSVILVALLLAGCGQASVSRTVTASVENGEQKTFPEEKNENVTENTLREDSRFTDVASDVFAIVTGISEEWQDGLYVVNGKNSGGDKICGIMDEDGNVEIFDGYTALYPLDNGNLIAATEQSVAEFQIPDGAVMQEHEATYDGDWNEESNVGIIGNVIDRYGNVLYETKSDEGIEKMYPISSEQIMVLRVQEDFEGIRLDWRVMNQEASFETSWEQLEQTEPIDISDDGEHWWFQSKSRHQAGLVQRSGKHENPFLRINDMIYWAKTGQWYNMNEFGIHSLLSVQDYQGNIYIKPSDGWIPTIFDGEATREILNDKLVLGTFGDYLYLGEIGDTPYFAIKEIVWEPNKQGEVTWNIYKGEDCERIPIDEKYTKAIYSMIIAGDKLILALRNNEQIDYVMSVDQDGTVLYEPQKIIGGGTWNAANPKYAILGHYSVGVIDTETGKQIQEVMPEKEYTSVCDDIPTLFLSDDVFAVAWEYDRDVYYEVYNINGGKIA